MTDNVAIIENGVDQAINTNNQSVSNMKEYKSIIFEDNCANRKVGQLATRK